MDKQICPKWHNLGQIEKLGIVFADDVLNFHQEHFGMVFQARNGSW